MTTITRMSKKLLQDFSCQTGSWPDRRTLSGLPEGYQRQIARRTRGLDSPNRPIGPSPTSHRTLRVFGSESRTRSTSLVIHSTSPLSFSPPSFWSTSRFIELRPCLTSSHTEGSLSSPGKGSKDSTLSKSGGGIPLLPCASAIGDPLSQRSALTTHHHDDTGGPVRGTKAHWRVLCTPSYRA